MRMAEATWNGVCRRASTQVERYASQGSSDGRLLPSAECTAADEVRRAAHRVGSQCEDRVDTVGVAAVL